MTQARRRLGAAGEARAATWYEEHGYEVLARNWRCSEGELDLVLGKGRLIVFSEVKTRSSDAFGLPAEAVGPVKQRKLRTLAGLWLAQAEVRPRELRFDVVSILAGQIEVIEAAF